MKQFFKMNVLHIAFKRTAMNLCIIILFTRDIFNIFPVGFYGTFMFLSKSFLLDTCTNVDSAKEYFALFPFTACLRNPY